MNKLVIYGIIFVVALVGATFAILGDNVGAHDYMMKLAIAGAVAIAVITTFVVVKYVRQMQNDTVTGELAEESWDGIGEYKNELPMGWAVIFLGTIVWAAWYFTIGYPVNAYSQIGEYNEEVATHDAEFEAAHQNMSQDDKTAMGESVFIVQCAPCHGLQADGMGGKAANLTHRIDPKAVKYVIMNGANNFKTDFPGGMPAGLNYMFANDAEINKVVSYVSGGFDPSDKEGAALFEKGTCTGCHGANGEGIPGAGIKLNGFNPEVVATVLNNGKKGAIGQMPKFTILTPKQVEAVGNYITDISK